ncbi:MAG: transglutaminase domain-containing protein [Deltaproteobacteria bacterium]|nr:transglutaminase domain-containing protein [Deltaproteobacteria bacterium]
MVHLVQCGDYFKVMAPGSWQDWVVFEGRDGRKRFEYTIVAPKELPLVGIALKNEIPGTISQSRHEGKDFVIHHWVSRDIQRIFSEPDMPTYYNYTQRLLVSTIKDWNWVSRWYWSLCEKPLGRITSEMKAKVDDLVRNKANRDEKINAIFKFVSQEVRYLGVNTDDESEWFQPHAVNLTFERRTGTCRDKAVLLVAMLRLADIDAYPVLIEKGPLKDPEVSTASFNHAITGVRNDDGSYVLMDSTDESTNQLLPSYLNNMSYLVISPDGESLRVTPLARAEENMMEIETMGRLDDAGGLTGQTILRFNGVNDNQIRDFFIKHTPQEQKQGIEGLLKNILPGAITAYEVFPKDIMDTSKTLEVHFGFTASDVTARGEHLASFTPPRWAFQIGAVNLFFNKVGLKERRFPFKIQYACGVRETIRILLPKFLWQVASLPTFENLDDETMSFQSQVRMEQNEIKCDLDLKVKIPEFSPRQYLALRENLEKLESVGSKMLLFYPPSGSLLPSEGSTRDI